MKHKLIIFTDIGDTVIDEGSEVRKVEFGVVYAADCIPGAAETYRKLHEQGYTIAMVADGLTESFQNTMAQHKLTDVFDAWIVSEEVGVTKPDKRMFTTAMEKLHLREEDKSRVIMVGNNLLRDVTGANRFGIRSVHIDWSPRYCHVPENAEQTPDYVIHRPEELLALVDRLDAELQS